MKKMSNSIIQNTKECYVCHTTMNLHYHHIWFGKNRKHSDDDGLTVYLCREHHEGTKGCHGKEGHELDHKLKTIAEQRWLEEYNKTKDDFIKRYGKNIL